MKTWTTEAVVRRFLEEAQGRGLTIPNIANEPADGSSLWRFAFGPYGQTTLYAFADHLEGALEVAFEWLDSNAPGLLVKIGDAELAESASELGIAWPLSDTDCERYWKVCEHAERDLTVCGHTTLTHGQYISSAEWMVDEVRL